MLDEAYFREKYYIKHIFDTMFRENETDLLQLLETALKELKTDFQDGFNNTVYRI